MNVTVLLTDKSSDAVTYMRNDRKSITRDVAGVDVLAALSEHQWFGAEEIDMGVQSQEVGTCRICRHSASMNSSSLGCELESKNVCK
jgi:hypothetical protein